MSEALGTGRLY